MVLALAHSKPLGSVFELLHLPFFLFWSHAKLCIDLFSILDVSDLPDALKYVIGDFVDFRFKILILLDPFDVWWFFLGSQIIDLGKKRHRIFSDL